MFYMFPFGLWQLRPSLSCRHRVCELCVSCVERRSRGIGGMRKPERAQNRQHKPVSRAERGCQNDEPQMQKFQ